MRKRKRKIEWNVVVGFGVVLFVWMLFGMPVLNWVAEVYSSFAAYGIYLVGVCALGFFVGSTFKRGLDSAVVSLSLMVFTDMVFPPLVISLGHPPSAEILSLWGSDTFMYIVWSWLGLGHELTWGLTYLLTPMLCVLALVFFLSGKKLKKSLMVILNGV